MPNINKVIRLVNHLIENEIAFSFNGSAVSVGPVYVTSHTTDNLTAKAPDSLQEPCKYETGTKTSLDLEKAPGAVDNKVNNDNKNKVKTGRHRSGRRVGSGAKYQSVLAYNLHTKEERRYPHIRAVCDDLYATEPFTTSGNRVRRCLINPKGRNHFGDWRFTIEEEIKVKEAKDLEIRKPAPEPEGPVDVEQEASASVAEAPVVAAPVTTLTPVSVASYKLLVATDQATGQSRKFRNVEDAAKVINSSFPLMGEDGITRALNAEPDSEDRIYKNHTFYWAYSAN